MKVFQTKSGDLVHAGCVDSQAVDSEFPTVRPDVISEDDVCVECGGSLLDEEFEEDDDEDEN